MTPEYNEKVIQKKMALAAKRVLSGGGEPDREIQGDGPPNRHGLPQLPPGQHEVKNWPILDLGVQPDIAKGEWRLEVKGEVEKPFTLGWEEFMDLPQVVELSDFHCVTSWSRMDNQWEGVHFRTIAERAKVNPAATHVYLTGYDGYSTNLKLEEALDEDVLLVHKWEGRELTREHGGPVRMVVPRKYAWKGAKWIKEISFGTEEKLGFWEVRGYSNTAEPWYNDRYAY